MILWFLDTLDDRIELTLSPLEEMSTLMSLTATNPTCHLEEASPGRVRGLSEGLGFGGGGGRDGEAVALGGRYVSARFRILLEHLIGTGLSRHTNQRHTKQFETV